LIGDSCAAMSRRRRSCDDPTRLRLSFVNAALHRRMRSPRLCHARGLPTTARQSMRQLSAHDASFLYSDTSHSNSNVTLIQIYDQSTAPGGKVRFKSILAHIESRLSGLPIFRSKLQRVPLDLDLPYWVDDPNFDLEYHVRHIALPKPGDWRQFCIQASRIHSRPLDLNRPLWEIYVVEGLTACSSCRRAALRC
jgi:hypothetical protein